MSYAYLFKYIIIGDTGKQTIFGKENISFVLNQHQVPAYRTTIVYAIKQKK